MVASVTRVLCCIAIGYFGICYTRSVLCSYRLCCHLSHVFCVV